MRVAASVLIALILVGCERDGAPDAVVVAAPPNAPVAAAHVDRRGTADRLRRSLDVELVRAELRRRGDSVSDEEVAAEWPAFAAALGKQRLGRLIRSGVTLAELKNRVRVRLEFERLVRDETERPVSDAEIREFFERNRARYAGEQAFVAREIFLSASGADAAERRLAEMRRIVAELESGTDFPVLARRYSEAASATRGGSTGRLTIDTVDSRLWRVLFSLETGEHRIVSLPEGVYLVELAASIPARETPPEKVREEITRNILAQRRSTAISKAILALRAGSAEKEDRSEDERPRRPEQGYTAGADR